MLIQSDPVCPGLFMVLPICLSWYRADNTNPSLLQAEYERAMLAIQEEEDDQEQRQEQQRVQDLQKVQEEKQAKEKAAAQELKVEKDKEDAETRKRLEVREISLL
jgi:hypothetical protein